MADKIEGRDLNGMRAANWSLPNLAAINSVKVDPKCSNAELLEAIKTIVGEAVAIIRGTSADDKYRNIVDMLMLRIRGALAKSINQIEKSQLTIDQQEIIDSITDAVAKTVNEDNREDTHIGQNDLKLLSDAVIDAVESSSKNYAGDVIEQHTIEKTVESTTIEKTVEYQLPQASKEVYEKQASVTLLTADAITVKDIDSLSIEIDKNFKKIELMIQQSTATPQVNILKADTDIVKASIKILKSVLKSTLAIELKTAIAKPLKKENSKDSKQKTNDVLTGRLFASLISMLSKDKFIFSKWLTSAIESTNKMFDELNKQLKSIEDNVSSKKTSLIGILAVIGLFLIPMFWDKIVGFFSWLNETFGISDIISKFISSIDWGKYIGTVSDYVLDAIKKKFHDFCENPFGWVKLKFLTAYTAVTTWTKDVWGWIKSKLGWTKEKQDENEAKAEATSTSKFEEAMARLELHTDANVQNVLDLTNETCELTNNVIQTKSAEINDAVNTMQQQSTEAITTTTEEVRANNEEITGNILPTMAKDISGEVDTAAEKVNNRSDNAILASENRLNAAVDNLDKTIKENGAPTNVSTETLNKMNSEADANGGSIKTGGIDQNIEMPKNTVLTTVEQQGKTVELFAKKEDIDRAANENADINKLMGSVTTPTSLNVNVNVNQNSTQLNILNKILVKTGANTVEKEAAMYENMNTAVNEMSKSSTVIEDGIKLSSNLLNALKSTVSEYFVELNSLVKVIKDKPNGETKNTIVLTNNAAKSDNSALMDEF